MDAAAERGRGLVATWRSDLPRWFGLQIDHVFTTGGIQLTSLQVLDIPGSDHRALLNARTYAMITCAVVARRVCRAAAG